MNHQIDVASALPELRRQFREAARTGRRPTDPQKEAIRAVFTAVDATRVHLRNLRGVEPKAYAPNEELVDLWSDAAIELAAFDVDLSTRMRLKAEFWSDPDHWDDEECEHARIQIEDLATSARELLQRAVPTPRQHSTEANTRVDCFLSHASEDTHTIAAPLARAIETRGYRVWFDDFSLRAGDSLRGRIDEALSVAKYGIFVLSPSFFAKPWPMREVRACFALEDADGRKRVIPVWHLVDDTEIARHSPLLADRLGIPTDIGLEEVANRVIEQVDAGRQPI